MTPPAAVRHWWWIVHKDLLREWRAPRAWPATLLLGIVLALAAAMQIELAQARQAGLAGGLFWLAAFFAATAAIERSFAGEREEGCWDGLLLYPAAPATIFLAKFAVNLLALLCLNGVLIPAFFAFAGAPLGEHVWGFLAIVILANTCVAAAGTIVSALTQGLGQRTGLFALLLLPLISPVVLGASQATQTLFSGAGGALSNGWGQLLAVFAALLVVLGAMLFEFLIED